MVEMVDVVIIGAGQAGLAVSHLLQRDGVRHLILERGATGESWRSQRWDSFCLNTPNWCNSLPGLEFAPDAPDAFGDRDQFVAYLERYVHTFGLPVRQHTPVTGLEQLPSGGYGARFDSGTVQARAVVLASGSMSRPRLPAVASQLARGVRSIPAGAYRTPASLPPGAVVVVGSGQSGCQIAEDLLEAGRRVYLSASRVGRVPRVYRGRDILAWWREMGFLDVRVEELEDSTIQFAAQPHVSGTRGGHTVSLQSLARDGATLLGRMVGIDGVTVTIGDDLIESIAFADGKARSFKAAIDEWIEARGIVAEPPGDDPGEPTLLATPPSARIRTLDLGDAGVSTVIWCTGFDADWNWVRVDILDEAGRPRHVGGITDVHGLYLIGHPWLSKRASGILYGIAEDAARIVGHIEREVLSSPSESRSTPTAS